MQMLCNGVANETEKNGRTGTKVLPFFLCKHYNHYPAR